MSKNEPGITEPAGDEQFIEKEINAEATTSSGTPDTSSEKSVALAVEDVIAATGQNTTTASATDERDMASPVAPPAGAPPGSQPGGAAPEEGRTKLETSLIMFSLCSALFLAALDVTIVTVAIPTIAAEFHSTAGYTWIGSAYLLANAATAPSWGKISDIWGRKPILIAAAITFWIGSLISAVSRNMGMLIAGRAIQGVGGGGIVVMVNICISDLFSLRKRGMYLGIMGMVWAVAGGVGPVVGGAFTTKVTWRWCFYVNLPISGLGILLLIFVLKLHNPKTSMRQGFIAVDWLGSLTVTGGTLMFLFGLEFGGVTYPWNSAIVVCLVVFGVITIGLFFVIEAKVARYPVIPMRIFKRRSSIASLGCALFHGMVFIAGTYYLPLYFQGCLGSTPLLSGVYVLPLSISLAVMSTIAGVAIRKTGKYLPFIIMGMAFMTLGFGLFIDLGPTANWAKIIVFQIIAGIGVGPNFQSPLIALHNMVEQRDVGAATATFQFVRQLATSISVVIGGVVFQNGMQRQYPTLLKELGPDLANLLSGQNAAASVSIVGAIPGPNGATARAAYWNALKDMYIMYAAFAACGLFVSFFVVQRTLSKEFKEHKTGLHNMRDERAAKKAKAVAKDEEKTAASSEPAKE